MLTTKFPNVLHQKIKVNNILDKHNSRVLCHR